LAAEGESGGREGGGGCGVFDGYGLAAEVDVFLGGRGWAGALGEGEGDGGEEEGEEGCRVISVKIRNQ